MYKPQTPFSTALILLIPTKTEMVKGVAKRAFPAPENGVRINGSFKTYGGTDRDINGLYSVEDTAVVETWFDPRITSECRVQVQQTGAVYEILNEPENIELRNQYVRFKIRRVKGGA